MKIAITGKMGSGKSFVANKLVQNYGFVQLSFAERVKELACELFNMQGKNRSLLIDLATKMRSIDRDVWIRSMLVKCEKHSNVVVDDLRLNNEYHTLKQLGWYLVKINIDENKRHEQLRSKYGYDYISHIEHAQSITENDVVSMDDSDFDYIIRNDDDITQFIYTIREMLALQYSVVEKY